VRGFARNFFAKVANSRRFESDLANVRFRHWAFLAEFSRFPATPCWHSSSIRELHPEALGEFNRP